MITIYANWTGNSLATGATLDGARAQLTAAHCLKDTVFGDGVADVTALDTGPHDTIGATHEKFDRLSVARDFFALVSAEGPARVGA